MGSFNVACSVSRISINFGDPVAYFPLEPYEFAEKIETANNLLIYPWCYYVPISLPIFGEYADYGYIDAIEKSENIKIVEKYFKKPIGEILGEDGNPAYPGMFVHRDIYQCLIDNQVNEWGKTPKKNDFGYCSRDFLNKKYKECQLKLIKISKSKKDLEIAMASFEFSRENYFNFNEYETFNKVYRPVIQKGKLRKQLVDFILFGHSLSYANVHYFPAANGYQCGNHYGNKILHEKTIEILKKKIREEEKND